VSKTTFGFLAALDEFGASSQAEIGRRLGVDRKNLSEEAVVLEERKFIKRRPDPQDVRRNRMEITPAGQALLNELNDSFRKIQDIIFGDLPADERAKLHDSLLRVIHARQPD
jgi:DNA-binding MarR family transcriptional regulator